MTLTRRTPIARLSAVGLGLSLLALTAQAQTSPWSIGLNQRFEHQSNVFQAAAGASDTVSTTSLVGGLDLPVGRQRFFARASFGHVRYGDQSQLNHDGYSLAMGVNWETAGNLSGSVSFDSSRTLAEFTPAGLNSVSSNNLTKTDGGRVTVRLGAITRLTFEAGAAVRRTRFDNPNYISRNVDINEISGGVRYRPEGALVLGLGLRATRGEYPNLRKPQTGGFRSEGFNKDNIDLTAEWPISGASRLDGRLSIGKDRYDTLAARDFSGVTGEVNWRWQPTGRSALTTSFTRRSGDDTGLALGPGLIPYATAANQVSNTLSVTGEYDLTGKIKARGGVSYTDGTFVNLLAAAGTGTGSEKVSALTLGLAWEASRAIRAGCDFSTRSRSVKTGAGGFDSNTFGCFGEFVLR